MKRLYLFTAIFFLLIGCNTKDQEADTKNKIITADEKEAKQEPDDVKEKEEKQPQKKEMESNLLRTDIGDLTDDMDVTIPKLEIDSPFAEDGNMKYEHTEMEIVEEYMDGDGRIYFEMDDYPIRSITNEEGNISNMTNYSDAYINMVDGLAYVLPEAHIPSAYDLFVLNPPKDLRDLEREDYRTWEEATNLERGIMQIVLLSSQPLNDLGTLMERDVYSSDQFDDIQKEFFDLGKPTVLIPAPQSMMDMTLFENMLMIKELWEELGKFEHPEQNKDAFEQLYMEVRQEMNHIIVRVNYTLSEEIHG